MSLREINQRRFGMQKGTGTGARAPGAMGTRTKRVWRRLVALAVVVGSVAAFAPVASADMIYSCVVESSGTIKITRTADECNKSQVLLTWNDEGVKGARRDRRPGHPGCEG